MNVVYINKAVGLADKTAKEIAKELNLVAPTLELAPSVQSRLEHVAKAVETSHKNMLGPIHSVTNGLVTKAELEEVKAVLSKEVIPEITVLEAASEAAHLASVALGSPYAQACHLIDTSKSAKCVAGGTKAIDTIYAKFENPVRTTDTFVIALAKTLAIENGLIEKYILPGLEPIISLMPTVKEMAHVIKDLDKDVRHLKHELKHHIHIKIGLVDVHFTVEHLLKEWKKEVHKLEHVIKVDKLKAEMRHAVDKVLHPVTHKMTKFIHHLESNVKIDGYSVDSVSAEFKKLSTKKVTIKFSPTLMESAEAQLKKDIAIIRSCK